MTEDKWKDKNITERLRRMKMSEGKRQSKKGKYERERERYLARDKANKGREAVGNK